MNNKGTIGNSQSQSQCVKCEDKAPNCESSRCDKIIVVANAGQQVMIHPKVSIDASMDDGQWHYIRRVQYETSPESASL